ncbi:MAG: Lrp/AsnC family transcriptional regulator, partial [Candidatus Aenigmarchaeota archaeon]|nr:Lrp/AsnC family transcriptional regulator [Candidatus Aenigmarchaeota archaeon]
TPLTKIAKRVGLSRDSVSYRVKNLTRNGVIQGYIALVDIRKFGYTPYHIFLNLSHPTREIEDKIIKSLKGYPFIRAILKFSGKYDFELAVIAKNIEEFDSILTNIISLCSEYLQSYEILIISKNYAGKVFPNSFFSDNTGMALKMKKEIYNMDKKDIDILKNVSNNANMPLHNIGNKINLSADAVNYRIRKMRESGIIENFLPVINYSALNYSVYAILMNINNLTEKKEATLKQILNEDDNVLWAVKTVGKYNILFYLCVRNADDLHNTIIKLRTYFRDDVKEYETLIAQEEFKYSYFPEGLDVGR